MLLLLKKKEKIEELSTEFDYIKKKLWSNQEFECNNSETMKVQRTSTAEF